MNRSRTLGAAVAAAIGLTLLTGCGSSDAGAVPDGWGKLDTKSLSVGYPKDKGYKEQSAADRSKSNAAVALKTEGGLRTGMVSVQLDFATGVDDAGEAAAAAGAGIGLGATRKATSDVRLAGEESARDARRIDYEFTSSGREQTPASGTPDDGGRGGGGRLEGRTVRHPDQCGEGLAEREGSRRVRRLDHREVARGGLAFMNVLPGGTATFLLLFGLFLGAFAVRSALRLGRVLSLIRHGVQVEGRCAERRVVDRGADRERGYATEYVFAFRTLDGRDMEFVDHAPGPFGPSRSGRRSGSRTIRRPRRSAPRWPDRGPGARC